MALNIQIVPPLKLRIELENMPFEISRTVLVPESINMYGLHVIIQNAMGWKDDHPYQFSDKKGSKSTIEISEEEPIDEEFLEENFKDFPEFLNQRIKEMHVEDAGLKEEFYEKLGKKPFFYWYDTGDYWWHKISFKKVTKKDLDVYQYLPLCLEAKGACPPEEIRRPWRFHNFFMTVNDKKSPLGKDFRELLGLKRGVNWDFESVDFEKINQNLKEAFSDEDE
jgi:hypothetical protein